MIKPRKSADDREKDLLLALAKIVKGRSQKGESKVTISAVAREAGISTSLIHNHYPRVAEAIRDAQGRSSRAQRDIKQDELVNEREKSAGLRKEIKKLRSQIAMLTSINEVYSLELRELKAKASAGNVLELGKKRE